MYHIEDWMYLDIAMVIRSACLLLCELNKYALPIVFIIECGVVNKI